MSLATVRKIDGCRREEEGEQREPAGEREKGGEGGGRLTLLSPSPLPTREMQKSMAFSLPTLVSEKRVPFSRCEESCCCCTRRRRRRKRRRRRRRRSGKEKRDLLARGHIMTVGGRFLVD